MPFPQHGMVNAQTVTFFIPEVKEPFCELFLTAQFQLLLFVHVLDVQLCQQLSWGLIIIQVKLEVVQSKRSFLGSYRL